MNLGGSGEGLYINFGNPAIKSQHCCRDFRMTELKLRYLLPPHLTISRPLHVATRLAQAPLQLFEFLVNFASVRATKFEFEKRFWIICAIYFAGFFLSVFDRTPFIAALRHLIAPSVMPGSAEAERFARIVILFGSLLVFLAAALRTWGAGYLRTEVVHDTAQHSEALVADGPFRYTRNPLYLATCRWPLESASWPAVPDLFFWC
jgi:protein-S-isoprenylcysteine O-methyltransferase Ste14